STRRRSQVQVLYRPIISSCASGVCKVIFLFPFQIFADRVSRINPASVLFLTCVGGELEVS
ncbi:MAG: hypothetical protein ACYS8I_06630, partial [Planctomycetota bacterium]